ncbi:hypothetical protein MN608_06872 [Microdochium nivale]|nr:hypothetical protein MN608_06872 [Microdochium nivale]
MPRGHHRSRSSIDRTLDLLADLDDGQVELLLQEANSTADTHVAVAQAITLFSRPGNHTTARGGPASPPPQPRKFFTSLSKKGSMRRRPSSRAAPEPRRSGSVKRSSFALARTNSIRSVAAATGEAQSPPATPRTKTSIRSSLMLVRNSDADDGVGSEEMMQAPHTPRTARSANKRSSLMLGGDFDFGDFAITDFQAPPTPRTKNSKRSSLMVPKNRNSVTLDAAHVLDAPMSPTRKTKPPAAAAGTKMSRAYKRISRPFPMLPGGGGGATARTQNIHDLLAAYFSHGSSTSSLSSASDGSSPITPRSASSPFGGPSFVTFDEAEAEGPDSPWEDLFEPLPAAMAPTRSGGKMVRGGDKSYGNLGSLGPMREPSRNISGIFEVLGPVGPALGR